LPRVLGVELVAAARHCANVGLGRIGVPQTGILPHIRIAYLFYTTAFPFVLQSAYPALALLCFVL
jgi:hypothetical protein